MTEPDPLRPAPYVAATSAPVAPTPTLSILSLVFGILGVVTGLFLFGLLPGAAGVVLGFIARRREPAAKGLWLTGIITGFVGVAIAVIVIVFYIVVFALVAANARSAGAFN